MQNDPSWDDGEPDGRTLCCANTSPMEECPSPRGRPDCVDATGGLRQPVDHFAQGKMMDTYS